MYKGAKPLSREAAIKIINDLEIIMSYLLNLLQGILMTKDFKKVLNHLYMNINCRNYVGVFLIPSHFFTLFALWSFILQHNWKHLSKDFTLIR